jgi:hypothetical protein
MVKQQNIVFFIGAGFSAPFGLPIMSNFINKARDLYFSDTSKYSDIGNTLELIEKYSVVKNYMHIDLHNIEDLLSISYMESLLKNTELMKHINDFIKIVIESYTDGVTNGVVNFTQYISNLNVQMGTRSFRTVADKGEIREFVPSGRLFDNSRFSVITLNYDLLIENALAHLSTEYGEFYIKQNVPNVFDKFFTKSKDVSGMGIPMAKLHGSIDGVIVPPTWNKNINEHIEGDWKLATNLLSDATHIIFLGYSLPPTDNYIRFLLSSSLNINKKLKNISVITMDNDGATQERYNSIFAMNLTFHNFDILNFFDLISDVKDEIDFDFFDEQLKSYLLKKK